MLTTRLTSHSAGKRGSRGRSPGRSACSRNLRVRSLEARRLLAVDFSGWQNLFIPADVNNDGFVTSVDALLIASDLYKNGSHALDEPAGPVSTPGPVSTEGPVIVADATPAQSDPSDQLYLDVNGDNYVTSADVLLVVQNIRSQGSSGQPELVVFSLETTDAAGTPISEINVGETFTLNVYVDDNRDPVVPDQGVFQAYLDVTFQDSLVSPSGPVVPGDAYQELIDPNSLATPGMIDEGGGVQTNFGLSPPYQGPLGPDPVLLYSVSFQATAPGTVMFTGDHQAYPSPQHDVGFFEPAVSVDDPSQIDFGLTTLDVLPMNADDDAFAVDEDTNDNFLDVLLNDETYPPGGTLTITDVGPTDNGGTVVNNGDHLLYTPLPDFAGTETFTYTIEDDLGNTDEATVTMTVNDLAEGELLQFRLETTDLMGTPVSDVDQNDSFLLNVYVQDIRPATVSDRGVFQAYVDVTFDGVLVTALDSVATLGPAYQGLGSPTSGSVTPGLVDEAGGVDTDFGLYGPLGPGEFLLFSVRFEASNPGTVIFASDSSDDLVYHPVLLFEPPGTVATDDIVFTTTTLTINVGPLDAFPDAFGVNEDSPDNFFDVLLNDQINTTGTLFIADVGPTDNGGTVVNNGDHLLYTPAHDFAGTETFTYTIGDGLGNTDQATVTVTVDNVPDAPVAYDDGGPAYETSANAAFTTGNVLDNDTDADVGDTLSVAGIDTTGTLGLVTDNGNGTFGYNPNGQFDYLAAGQPATDTFRYTVSDGNGGLDTAVVTITVTGTLPPAGQVTGYVYADVDNDGVKDAVERAIGGVEMRLQGTNVLGSAVSLSTVTDALGRYGFSNVLPGSYVLTEVQPNFYVDGIDTVNGVVHTGANDTVTISPAMNLANLTANFGERSLEPDFINIGDFLNPPPCQGIVIGFDTAGNMLWYSLLDGWDGVTAVNVTLSGDGSTAIVTIWRGASGSTTFNVPTAPSYGQFRVKGETNEGRVVQLVGTLGSFVPAPSPSPEGLAAPDAGLVDAVFAELGSETSAPI